MDEQLYECPASHCERAFDEEYKLDQHMNDTKHECDCDGECCEQYTEEDWDDEQPIPEVRSQPPRQASAEIMSLAGQALQDPDECDNDCVKSLAASHLAIGRVCSSGCCENRAKIDCWNDSCGECCQGCPVH